jgi:YggT family protein
MFAIANLLVALAAILNLALSVYMWIIIARVIVSWVIPFRPGPFVHSLAYGLSRVTDPVLSRIQRYIPLRGAGLDFSPFIAILIIVFLQHFLVGTLIDLARRL